MTKPVAIPTDAERATIDHLIPQLAAHSEDVTCGVVILSGPAWADATKPHVQVGLNGTPTGTYPMTTGAIIRLTAWATSTTVAKRLASLSQGIMLAHPGGGGIQSVNFMTGVDVTKDPDTEAQLATCTVRVNTSYAEA